MGRGIALFTISSNPDRLAWFQHLWGFAMTGLNWKLEDDLKTVTLTIPTTPPTVIKYDAAAIDDMLQNLGEFRAHMKPAYPDAPPTGKMKAIPDPRWYCQQEEMEGNSLL